MKLQKSTLSLALTAILCTGTTQAEIIEMNYSGLFTYLDPAGNALSNTSLPYYYDATWGYGYRTQIAGTLNLNTSTGLGNATVNPFAFDNAGDAVVSDFNLKNVGSGLLIGNMNFSWNGSNVTTQIVLDASGLFAEFANGTIAGDTYNSSTCLMSGACATPASDDIRSSDFPIGPAPVATSSLNTIGQTGFGSTLGQLSLGSDDGIGGSPQDNGPFSGFYFNFDMTTVTVTSAVPIPAAFWLFGSGLITLAGLSRRRKNRT